VVSLGGGMGSAEKRERGGEYFVVVFGRGGRTLLGFWWRWNSKEWFLGVRFGKPALITPGVCTRSMRGWCP